MQEKTGRRALLSSTELPRNVPDIRTIYSGNYTQQRLCFAHRDYATVDGRRSQPSTEKVPVRVAGR